MNENKIVSNCIRQILHEVASVDDDGNPLTYADLIANRLQELAKAGTAWAAKLYVNRLEGRPMTAERLAQQKDRPDLTSQIVEMAENMRRQSWSEILSRRNQNA